MITIATEIWIATATLHRRHPERADFTITEIREQVARAALAGTERPGVLPHLYVHCVANRKPNPARLRLLFATGRRSRRLYRPGDPCDPGRGGGQELPDQDALPEAQRGLIDWYRQRYLRGGDSTPDATAAASDPILRLRGLGKALWEEQDPDAYVDRLRSGWQ